MTIPSSVTEIKSFAFDGCYFTKDTFVNNSKCTSTDYWGATMCDAIQDDGLIIKDGVAIKCRSFATSVTIPESVTSIAREAFSGCSSLNSVNMPETLTNIASYAFLNCSGLTAVKIPNSINKIEYGAFNGCSNLESISLPNSLKEIDSYTFSGCSRLASVKIPESVATISVEAFSGCSALPSITIPKSVWYISNKAFYGCSNLTSVTCEAKTPPQLGTDVFSGVPTSAATLYVPVSAVETYKTKAQWQDFGTITRTDEEDYTEGTCGKDITWKLGLESGRLTIEGTGAIPDYSYSGVPWYSKRKIVKQVILSEGITSIGKYAFYRCDSITSVTINGAITSIGEEAFSYCSKLTTINLPESLTSIGEEAFYQCSNLTSITLPYSVTSIGRWAFSGCPLTVPLCTNKIFFEFYPKDYSEEYKISEGIETIQANAFSGCLNLSSVTIPSSVTTIGNYAFSGCYFTKDKFINNSACTSESNWGATICDVIQEDGLMISGTTVIKCKTSATVVNIPDYVTIIGADAFSKCDLLTSVNIPASVDSVGNSAFEGCSSLPVIDNLRYADTYLVGCVYIKGEESPSTYIIKEGTRFIGSYAFGEAFNPTSVTIPSTVEKIGDFAFCYSSNLKEIILPSSLKSIGQVSFRNCSGLTSLVIPSSVTYIGPDAFSGCSFKRENFVNNSSCTSDNYWGASILDITEDGLIISGKQVIGCDKMAKSVSIPDYVTSIGSSAFTGCSELTSVYIPNSVTSIGSNAFYGCTNLSSLNIPNSVTYIGSYEFYGCTRLTAVTLPNALKSIEAYLFQGCSGLKSIRIPDSVVSIGTYAFQGCAGIKMLTIPNTVTSVGNYAFSGCSGMTTLTMSNALYSIGTHVFDNCTALTSLVIPSSVTSIGDYAFSGCTSLAKVELPAGLTTIKTYAFDGCKKLESMTLPSSVTTLGDNFISHCKDLYAPFEKIVKTKVSLTGTLHVPNGATSVFTANGWSATRIYDDIDVRFVIASGTHGTAKWELAGNTLTILSTYGTTAKMTSSYTTYGTIEYDKYPWYEYRNMVKHVVIRGFSSIGEACLKDMNYLESLTTSTTEVSLYKNETTKELFTCFGKSYQKDVYEYYSNGSIKVKLYKFLIPSNLSKVVYTGETFNMNYFSGGVVSSYETKTDEFHPTKPFEIIATNVTSVGTAGTKSLKNTKVYITYTGNLTSGLFRDMGDLYSLTLNGTGVATEGGAFYTLFGSATYNQDMMYGGGGYYIPKNLKELHLMEGVTSIPEACFKNVTSLEKVYLPSTLRGVQDNAFLNCDGLTDIYVNAAMPPSAKENTFDGVNIFLCTLHIPYDSKQYYSIARGWRDFYTIDNDADIRLTIVKNIENAGQIIGVTSYLNGETTNITAVANGGYKFVEWTDEEGNRISDKPVLSVVATISCIYRAIFVPVSNTGKIECLANGNSIKLNWDTNPQVSYYKIKLYTSSEMEEAVKEIDVDANGTIRTRGVNDGISVEISDLESRTSYYYRIVGYDSDENIQDVYIGTFETTEITHIYGILDDENTVLGIYNVRGEKIPQMTRGINIIKMKNGTTKKIIIK